MVTDVRPADSGLTMIQQRACPSCGRTHSLNMGAGGHFCLSCRYRWSEQEASLGAPFSVAELRRLAIYRRAVVAGFFTDWL